MQANHETCTICQHIPQSKHVETLHTDERLPEQVDQLLVIGGHGLYGSEQVRKCPECGTYYSFLHDHDSESGVGYGYTDEAIVRLEFAQALAMIEKTIRISERSIVYWTEQTEAGISKYSSEILKKHQEELVGLKREKKFLNSIK